MDILWSEDQRKAERQKILHEFRVGVNKVAKYKNGKVDKYLLGYIFFFFFFTWVYFIPAFQIIL